MIEITQGEDFFFNISETNPGGVPVSLDQYPDVIAYLFTREEQVLKFSKSVKAGYQRVTKVTSFEYRIKLMAEDSKQLMPGTMVIEILILDPTERAIFRGEVARVVKSKIKREI
jgi:hypothetical protein